MSSLNIPGTSTKALLVLPLRTVLFGATFTVFYPIILTAGTLRALFLRFIKGKPSQILAKGTYGNVHEADNHYPSQQLFSQPFDEAKLRKALVELCAEDGIAEDEVDLEFVDEVPQDWPASGSFKLNHFTPKTIKEGSHFFDYWQERGKSGKKMRVRVFNGPPGKPTVVFYAGSMNGWDGSSNYNFNKELQSRYMGLAPTAVFEKPTISPDAAAKADAPSFLVFLAKLPINVAFAFGGALWNGLRSAQWAGGNGFGFKITAMNFNEAESKALYNGAKTLGVTPFACFTFAAHRACKAVLGQGFKRIVQQASLQTRHFPVENQGKKRDFVGDWLVGPIAYASEDYSLQEAQHGYEELLADLDAFGPRTQRSFMAKSYNVVNCGAAPFEVIPTYNDDAYVFDRCLFMNNYGVRTNPNPAFEAWNWNAPFWLGLNTISVNGKTTTLIGSAFWGLEVVEALRDHIEATLRDIMSKAPKEGGKSVPVYEK